MSVNVEMRVDAPGQREYAEEAWDLKERIRVEEGLLKQRRGFFMDAYRRANTYLLYENDALVAFASTRRDGYILFLAVSPDARGEGYGKRLVAEVAKEHPVVTCHARTTNTNALDFYEKMGFEVRRRIENYYEDGGAAFYLRLGEEAGLREKLSEFLRR
ncbi:MULTISPECIES: GNAT family N-acetyltransferase [Haloferax]|uniref:Putative acetyltransferase n=1 Tax=Haloferax massiliensis TaxID=1476858 RepID=A0A0D6JNT4_9EURY|nr:MULTISPECIES: N-acetyltransferase [Haloferax]MDS0241128.1 GNAT family N-acetyltransferase [Haloferax sp. S2CR25]MDS0444249.1 GNAT family N-acetyltransferase [Haloferax sp. S2CR25-2]CQR49514.1 putative acetyltransferase [Haloferax massiliensis]